MAWAASAVVVLMVASVAAAQAPTAGAAVASRGDAALRAKAEPVVAAWFERAGVPGATVAVVMEDGREAELAVGLARKAPPIAMRPGDRMMSGSIGKTFVAAAMLGLVEAGQADLDAKVSTWLGDRAWYARVPNSADVTLRMLMNHSSGIREHVTSPEFIAALRDAPEQAWKPEELAAFALDQEPLFAAGQGWSYADTNYIFVGMVIEEITGKKYEEVVRERVLEARGLDETTPVEGPELSGLVSGYTAPGKPFHVPEEVCVDGRYAVNPQFEWTGGGMVTTAADLARWARMLYGGAVLREETRRMMLDGVPAKTGPRDKYGLGVQIWPTRHGDAVGHSGYFPGYVSIMAWYPEKRVAVAVQVNTDVGTGKMGLRRVLDELVEAAADAKPE